MSEGLTATNLSGLEERYEIVGELRGSPAGRTYIGRPRDGSAEVAITVFQRPKGGESNELSHYAADEQILESVSHPSLARVLDGQWLGGDAYAIVTERIQGETLAERLERGERFGNPGIALLLQDVSRVLDWARDNGIVHRLITADTIFFERDTNRVRMCFAPAALPITGVPGATGDMRTLGMLAWTMFTGERYDESSAHRSLGEAAPNLATRVVDATDKAIRGTDDGESTDVATFLGIIASGDVLKQAEVEMAAMKEEYDEEHRRELQKCENQRQQVEEHAAEQAAILAGEREDFAKHMEDERAAMAAERAEFERVMAERKDRLAAVRAELDQQRAEMEKRLADLEAYRVEVEKARDAAIAASEKARQDAIEAAEKWRKEALAASAAAAAAATAAAEAAMKDANAAALASANPNASETLAKATPLSKLAPLAKMMTPSKAAAPVLPPPPPPAAVPKVAMPTPPKALKEMKAPKWDKHMERLDATDEELIAATAGRPKWMIPAGVAALAIIIIAVVFSLTHRTAPNGNAVKIGNTTLAPTPANTAAGIIPRGGFMTQPPAGASQGSAAPAPTSPLVADSGAARLDSAAGALSPTDSAARVKASQSTTTLPSSGGDAAHSSDRASASSASDRAAAARAARNAASATTSASTANPPSNTLTSAPTQTAQATPRPSDSAASSAPAPSFRTDSAARAARARLDSAAATMLPHRDSTVRPDTTGKPPTPPDTLARR